MVGTDAKVRIQDKLPAMQKKDAKEKIQGKNPVDFRQKTDHIWPTFTKTFLP